MPKTRKFCPHCNEVVSSTTYNRHRAIYFNESSKSWTFEEYNSSDLSSGAESDPGEDMQLEGMILEPHPLKRKLMINFLPTRQALQVNMKTDLGLALKATAKTAKRVTHSVSNSSEYVANMHCRTRIAKTMSPLPQLTESDVSLLQRLK